MRVNLVSSVRFGTYLDAHNVRIGPETRRPVAPVTTYKAETPDQLANLDTYKKAREAYDAAKNDKAVEQKEKDRLKKEMNDAEKVYLRSIGLQG